MPNRANVAATWHADLCKRPEFGYSQSQRWGDSSRVEDWTCEGVTGTFFLGDRDCSSSVIDVWREALVGTPWEGALDAAIYTGNMRSVFVASGLFEWKPMSFTAQRGDVYLNEANHTAMCQSAVPDMLSEFSIDKNGGISGGQTGDQTGGESRIGAYYDYPWDGILHYNGKADGFPQAEEAVNGFRDVPKTAWYAESVRYVSDKGIMKGYGDGNFGPDNPVTRAELATVVMRLGL